MGLFQMQMFQKNFQKKGVSTDRTSPVDLPTAIHSFTQKETGMRFAMFIGTLFLLLGAVPHVNPAFGFDREDVNIHGFVSQGYLKSSDNNYLGNSKDGSFEFNEIGINFAALLTDELRFGAQVFSRDLGEYSNNDLIVDWAFLDYTFKDWLGFRAGKIRTPFGFYNRKRDADMLRTSILMPQSVYNEGLRDLILSFYGAGLYGSVDLNTIGFFDYEIYGGTLDISGGAPFVTTYLTFMQYANPVLYGLIDIATGGDWEGLEVILDHIEGGMLIWNTPISGLRVGATDLIGKGTLGGMEVDLGGGSTENISAELSLDQISALSAEYEFSDLTFTAEYMKIELNVDMSVPAAFAAMIGGIEMDPIKLEGYYGAISWDAFKWLTVGAAYGEYFPNADEKDGNDIKGEIPDYWAWQKDITLSVRFNLNEYFCVKLETHFYDGMGLASLNDNDPPVEAERNWILYAVKTSLNF